MLAKKNRLTKKEFEEVYKIGNKIHSKNFFAVFVNTNEPRASFVAPSKKFKKAVLRNKARRIGYSALKETNFLEKNIGIIFFYKNNSNIAEKDIKKELKEILLKVK